jgi:proteasome accessory factor A
MTRAGRRRSFDFWVGPVWRTGWDGIELPVPGWLSRAVQWCLLASVAPLAGAVWALVQFTHLGRMQRQLTAFLASRAVFAGAGGVDRVGHFHLAEKAGGVTCVAGLAEFARPMFSLAQLIKPFCLLKLGSLWRGRQRLQITLGDSNLCEEAEYLRVGTTLLIVEALEAEALDAPQLAHPVRALHAINDDCSLTVRVPLRDGRMMSALEIQRWYLTACTRFVEAHPDCPDEFHHVLWLWEDVLDRLDTDRDSLVGRIDWVTKHFLMERVAGKSTTPVRKKVDVKYHELSREGYFRLLEQAGLHSRLLADDEVNRALRLPPTGTPAMRRARFIREFAGTGMCVSWTTGSGRSR